MGKLGKLFGKLGKSFRKIKKILGKLFGKIIWENSGKLFEKTRKIHKKYQENLLGKLKKISGKLGKSLEKNLGNMKTEKNQSWGLKKFNQKSVTDGQTDRRLNCFIYIKYGPRHMKMAHVHDVFKFIFL